MIFSPYPKWSVPQPKFHFCRCPNNQSGVVPMTKVGFPHSQRESTVPRTKVVCPPIQIPFIIVSQEPKWFVPSQNGRFLVMEFTVEMLGINEYVNFFAKGIKFWLTYSCRRSLSVAETVPLTIPAKVGDMLFICPTTGYDADNSGKSFDMVAIPALKNSHLLDVLMLMGRIRRRNFLQVVSGIYHKDRPHRSLSSVDCISQSTGATLHCGISD